MRAAILLVAVAVGFTACSHSSDPTTTAAASPTQTTQTITTTTTTETSTTTSTVAPIATTAPVNPRSIDYPDEADSLDDLPTALTAYIGAPTPEPDLSIAGPNDLDRWMAGWLNWLAWVNANPSQGAQQLGVNMIPGSQQFDDIRTALLERAEAQQHLLGGGFLPTSLTGTFDEFFEDKIALRVVMIAGSPPSYLASTSGEIVSVFEGLEGEVSVSALLRYQMERDEWLMETFEVLGRS